MNQGENPSPRSRRKFPGSVASRRSRRSGVMALSGISTKRWPHRGDVTGEATCRGRTTEVPPPARQSYTVRLLTVYRLFTKRWPRTEKGGSPGEATEVYHGGIWVPWPVDPNRGSGTSHPSGPWLCRVGSGHSGKEIVTWLIFQRGRTSPRTWSVAVSDECSASQTPGERTARFSDGHRLASQWAKRLGEGDRPALGSLQHLLVKPPNYAGVVR